MTNFMNHDQATVLARSTSTSKIIVDMDESIILWKVYSIPRGVGPPGITARVSAHYIEVQCLDVATAVLQQVTFKSVSGFDAVYNAIVGGDPEYACNAER